MVKLFNEPIILKCDHCGKDLFADSQMSIIVFVEDRKNKVIKDVYVCCKLECDRNLQEIKVKEGLIDGWKDLSDLTNPILFLNQIMATFNRMKNGWIFEPNAFEKLKEIYLACAQYVMREPTESEIKRASDILGLPF
ncbi:MAG: hypothetical protein N2486_02045 [Caloramator sp.]|nr:hypothetical protein [Caloramator sp.]